MSRTPYSPFVENETAPLPWKKVRLLRGGPSRLCSGTARPASQGFGACPIRRWEFRAIPSDMSIVEAPETVNAAYRRRASCQSCTTRTAGHVVARPTVDGHSNLPTPLRADERTASRDLTEPGHPHTVCTIGRIDRDAVRLRFTWCTNGRIEAVKAVPAVLAGSSHRNAPAHLPLIPLLAGLGAAIVVLVRRPNRAGADDRSSL